MPQERRRPLAIRDSGENMNQPRRYLTIVRAAATPGDLAMAEAMLQRLKAGDDLRESKVRRVRHAIDSQEYENPLKLDVAADRMADELKS